MVVALGGWWLIGCLVQVGGSVGGTTGLIFSP